jgi:hypothetical protein
VCKSEHCEIQIATKRSGLEEYGLPELVGVVPQDSDLMTFFTPHEIAEVMRIAGEKLSRRATRSVL